MISQSIPQSEQDVKDLLMQIGSNYSLLTPDQRAAIISIFPTASFNTQIRDDEPSEEFDESFREIEIADQNSKERLEYYGWQDVQRLIPGYFRFKNSGW